MHSVGYVFIIKQWRQNIVLKTDWLTKMHLLLVH